MGSCSPFRKGLLFGLEWCTWDAASDLHISAQVLKEEIPGNERGPMAIFRNALTAKQATPGIVIDAGAQIGLFSAAALELGHYTVSIDARLEHIQMNMVSRALNGYYNSTKHGILVHGALSDQCAGQ